MWRARLGQVHNPWPPLSGWFVCAKRLALENSSSICFWWSRKDWLFQIKTYLLNIILFCFTEIFLDSPRHIKFYILKHFRIFILLCILYFYLLLFAFRKPCSCMFNLAEVYHQIEVLTKEHLKLYDIIYKKNPKNKTKKHIKLHCHFCSSHTYMNKLTSNRK